MLIPSSGTGAFRAGADLAIRLVKMGCTNRPFFHIVVSEKRVKQHRPVIEQLGSYDPIPNERNEKLVSLNIERIQYWVGNGADISRPVEQLLGLSGLFPIHPTSYIVAWRNRRKAAEETAKQSPEVENTAS